MTLQALRLQKRPLVGTPLLPAVSSLLRALASTSFQTIDQDSDASPALSKFKPYEGGSLLSSPSNQTGTSQKVRQQVGHHALSRFEKSPLIGTDEGHRRRSTAGLHSADMRAMHCPSPRRRALALWCVLGIGVLSDTRQRAKRMDGHPPQRETASHRKVGVGFWARLEGGRPAQKVVCYYDFQSLQ